MDRFQQEGCKVILIDLDEKKGFARVSGNERLEFLKGDVASQDTWERALSLADREYGRVDVVVNNAGEQS